MSEEAKTKEEVFKFLDETIETVRARREYQYEKWNNDFNDDCWTFQDWKAFINKYLAMAEVDHINFEYSGNKAMLDSVKHRLIDVAALAIAAVEAIRRNEESTKELNDE